MKLKTLSAIVLALSAVPAGANTCGIHDHLCRAHGLGAAHGSVNRDRNAPTGAVIYMQKTDTNAPNTDVDNHVLGAATDKNGRSNGSFHPTYTDYGARNPSRLAEWDTPDTKNRHIYGSAYANQFNNGQALAVHTGDFDGGENGKIPNATGCPTVLGSSKQNCEAVIITGNMPSGVYSQKAEMFNYHGVANPKADLTMGAYATGNMALISRSHVATSNGVAVGKAGNRVEHHTTLSGHGAKTQQYDYEFVNRGHKGHGAGTTTHNHLHNPARTHEPLRVTTEKLLVNTGKHEIPNFARYDAEQARNSLTVPDDPRVTVKRQPSPMLPETQQGRKGKGTPMATPAGFDVASNSTHNVPNLTDEQVVKQASEWLSNKMPESVKRKKDFGQNNTNQQPTKSRSDDEFIMGGKKQELLTGAGSLITTENSSIFWEMPEETCRKYGIGCDNTQKIQDDNIQLKVDTDNSTIINKTQLDYYQNRRLPNGQMINWKNHQVDQPYRDRDSDAAYRIANLIYREKDVSEISFNASYQEPYWGSYIHTGIDLRANIGKSKKVEISSLTDGIVKQIIPSTGTVVIQTQLSGKDILIGYTHMNISDKIKINQPIKAGGILGSQAGYGQLNCKVGGSKGENCFDPHLHLEFKLPGGSFGWVTNERGWEKKPYWKTTLNPLSYINEIEEKYFTIKK